MVGKWSFRVGVVISFSMVHGIQNGLQRSSPPSMCVCVLSSLPQGIRADLYDQQNMADMKVQLLNLWTASWLPLWSLGLLALRANQASCCEDLNSSVGTSEEPANLWALKVSYLERWSISSSQDFRKGQPLMITDWMSGGILSHPIKSLLNPDPQKQWEIIAKFGSDFLNALLHN